MFAIIAAHDANYGIGYQGTLPWNIPKDLKTFKYITQYQSLQEYYPHLLRRKYNVNHIICGRKTWDNIPEENRWISIRASAAALTLLMLDGFSYRDMAETLGITESNVGVKINRIKKHLVQLSQEETNHGL